MRKQIIALVLILVLSLLALPVQASTPDVTITLTPAFADKTATAYTDGEDTFTVDVSVSAKVALDTVAFALTLPQGVTYVSGSAVLDSGLKAKLETFSGKTSLLGELSFTESKLLFLATTAGSFTLTNNTCLFRITCRISDVTKAGSYTVGIDTAGDDFAVGAFSGATFVPASVQVQTPTVNLIADVPVYRGCQFGTVSNGKGAIRLVSTVNTLNHDNAGYEIKAYTGASLTYSRDVVLHVAYESANVQGKSGLTANSFSAKYLILLTVEDIPMTSSYLIIRPYVTHNGVKVYESGGKGYHINISASAFSVGGAVTFPK